MRFLTGLFLLLLVTPVATQAPPPRPSSPQPTGGTEGTLAQVMRGVMFPNSNIIFDVQTNDPGIERKLGPAEGGALATFANIYAGWEVVENAAIVLAEAPDLILKPGRLCTNGKPVPLERADFKGYAQGLREAARVVLKAAQEKSQEKVSDATSQLVGACLNCHQVYRTSPPGGASRCVPSLADPSLSDQPRGEPIGR
jgi:cytochrome c553